MKKIILQGIKFDGKSSFMRGASKAPEVIREVMNNGSSNLWAENGTLIDDAVIQDLGDFEINEYSEILSITRSNLSNNEGKLFTIGGDHSISYPVIKALSEKTGPFHVLHIDAHGDLYNRFEGDEYSHACPFARVMEDNLVLSLTQVGIRTLNDHQRDQAIKYNVTIHEMKDWDITEVDIRSPLYISLDMDAFDPAFAPGVSHHEPGGFSSRQVIELIQSIDVNIIGADVVEYNPDRDLNQMTAALSGKMIKEIVSMMIS